MWAGMSFAPPKSRKLFAPLVRTLFFAARSFRPRKNVSLAPRVPMSTRGKTIRAHLARSSTAADTADRFETALTRLSSFANPNPSLILITVAWLTRARIRLNLRVP